MNEEQRIALCKTSVNQIYTMLRTSPQDRRNYLPLGRSVIAHIDHTTFLQQPRRTTEQSWLIGGLQRLALPDNGNGNGNGEVPDLSAWCTRQWMAMLQREPQNVEALRGLGRAWLARAQPALARLHRGDGSSTSSGESSHWSAPSVAGNSSEDERQSAAAVVEAERRAGTAEYVEARGFLQPAVEYFERAIAAATALRVLSGDLLAIAAEAYISRQQTSTQSLLHKPTPYRARSRRMIDERELVVQPIVQDSVQHNARTVSNIRALTASLFGVAAGTLGLESFPGFIFYFLGTAIVSLLIYALKAESKPEAYFYRPLGDLWAGDMFGGLMSFVLTWTLFYGLLLEARLEQAQLLKKVVDAIKDLVQDCNFDCNDSGIALQAMDNSHVALVSMMLKSESFSPFRCDRNIALGINLTSLQKVLRCAQNEDILTVKAEDAPDVVNMVFESSDSDRISEYDIKLMDIDQEHLGIPDTEYAATISMPSSEFQRICRDLTALSESVAIECTKEGVKFACNGDIGSGAVTLRSHTDVEKPEKNIEINLSEPVALTFSLKYLVNFCKASGLSDSVKLCLSNEVPLLVEYALSNNSYLRFYLAPKIGDEE
ncbi:hypothetical protein B0A55_04196 [Friedmanniomyces simplex]|uniref:DNA sliding clamp PCNA n=1 Tax=Friedmanniomyces simplex TaxID=329884 RepID=A0A4U0XGZ1_9PEZI|nr:hypothetical protein B0A55_04196 [Friedmanniomyces simplex]